MKFIYEYRTSDNVRHSGIVDAPNREAAFVLLKDRGIKPGRVTEAPGFFNKLFGRGKRWLVIAGLGVGCCVLGVFWVNTREAVQTADADLRAARAEARELAFTFEDTTRRQVIGDVAVIEKGIATGWEDVFPHEGERFLASFAIPGVPAGLRNTSEEEIRLALARKVSPVEGDSLEARQIKSIVEGMKDELREFIAGGRHSIVEYGRRLVERQEQELSYYNRACAEVDAAAKSNLPYKEILELWEKHNSQLRQLGVRLVRMPEEPLAQ